MGSPSDNLLFIGPPGSGKSMMAARLPGLLPPLSPSELLQTSMVHSVAGLIAKGALTRARPFRTPHHSATMAALTGGGLKVKPGEVSLAHNGVLFLDELPEFSSQALDSLRQPRTLRLARTIADLDGSGSVRRVPLAEALIYRRMGQAVPALA